MDATLTESDAVRHALTTAADLGWVVIGVHDGEELHRNAPFTIEAVLEVCESVEDSAVLLHHVDGRKGTLCVLWQYSRDMQLDAATASEVFWNFTDSMYEVLDRAFLTG